MKKPGRAQRTGLFLAAAAFAVVLDQLTKAWIRTALPETGDAAPLVPGVIRLLHVENTGAAFSLGEGSGWLFVLIALAIAAFAFAVVWKEDISWGFAVSLASVAGGGIGNMIDRLWQGSVTDFFATEFMSFPVFNVADIFVTLGVISCLIFVFAGDGSRG